MKYLLCFVLILPQITRAQGTEVAGLAHYIPAHLTPDSLKTAGFREQEQPLVKGTLALLCTHVRTLTAARMIVEGIPLTNLVLHFYDDRLFRIECDYEEPVSQAFTRKFGMGVSKPVSQFRVCSQEKNKLMTVWGNVWPGEETTAFVVYQKGYNIECQPEEDARLILWNPQLSALCSECDLQPTNPLMEEYRQLQQRK